MNTKALYLDDSYLKEVDATILEVQPDGTDKWRVRLDQTVFYPMGGGQATDQGKLNEWEVYQVMMKDGDIWHYIKSAQAPSVETKVHGVINWERRYKNMRLHSGGHVVDFAMHVLGLSPKPLMPFKGDHSKKPHIVYQGTVTEDFQQKLEDKANELVKKNLKFSWNFEPIEELQKEAIYLQPGLPTNKPMRALRLETIGAVADGGTQVHETGEVGKIVIPLVETKENNTIVHYMLPES